MGRSMDKELLEKVGLTKTEIEVYLTLLQEESMIASKVAKQLQIQRPNVYDALKRLVDKGLASYVIKDKFKYFKATPPEKLMDYVSGLKKELEENEKKVSDLVLDLKKIKPSPAKGFSVEVYEGKEGIRTVLFDSLKETVKTKKEILGIGINNLKIKELDPLNFDRYADERAKIKAKSRYIIIEGTETYQHPNTIVKMLPKHYESPTSTYIYGNKVSIWLWFTIPVVIVIDSKEVAESYRSYFEVLWKLAE